MLYTQYTNPAGYPPLEHSSRILADNGWQVLFLGTGAYGADALQLPSHPNVAVRRMPFCAGGWRQKLHYLRFLRWSLAWGVRFRPAWVYASDPLSAPVALLLGRLPGVRVLYHEHDSPPSTMPGAFGRCILAARQRLANASQLCLLPNHRRLERFVAATGRCGPTFCVWNCPSLREVGERRGKLDGGLDVLYHGSLGPSRLPLATIDALMLIPSSVRLRVVGYETIGAPGYARTLVERAAQLALTERVTVLGPVSRGELMRSCRQSDVGLALLPLESDDPNSQDMTGASNKPFDYLACGLSLLVSDLQPWRETYVDPGYGIACRPDEPESIAGALRWYLKHASETRTMGELGRQKVLGEWNYERQFAPVLAELDQFEHAS